MYQFAYHNPAQLNQALELLSTEDAKAIAGGMTLIPTLKQRLAQHASLVDLSSIAELQGITESDGAIRIGAMTTHSDVYHSDLVKSKIPALSQLAGGIGDVQVRNRGTLGGSIANADPAADYPAAVVGLGATVHTTQRDIAADDFFTALFETALADDEIITAVSFPIPDQAGYAKFANPASRYAIVGVMVAKTAAGTRVAVTGAAGSAFRATEMEQALGSSFTSDAVRGIVVSSSEFNSDMHASAEYRGHLVSVMAARAVDASA